MTSGDDERLPSLRTVSESQWAALTQRRIFFGHQSVGGNIMAGIDLVLSERPDFRLNVVETRDLGRDSPTGFYHARIGRNNFPLEKLDDFVALASGGFGKEGDLAMVKLCYVDVHRDTDAQALFDEYRHRMRQLQARARSLRIVHFTLPLTIIENWKGRLMAAARGMATQRERNVVRHRYNELMRRTYLGAEPLFDLARLESTLPDGTRASFQAGGDGVAMLAHEYTDDGGHLNVSGGRMVAEQLLITLARTPW